MEGIVVRETEQAIAGYRSLDSFFTSFIEYLDVSQKTITTYSKALKQFFKYLYDNDIMKPQRKDILEYRNALREDGKRATTIQTYLTAIKRFFKWTAQERLYPNVADGIKSGTVSKEHKKNDMTSEQLRRIFTNINTSTETGKRNYAMLALMATAGLRTIELHRANIEDLTIKSGIVVLMVQGKGKNEKDAPVKLSDHTERAIRDYLATRPTAKGKDPLFTSTSNSNRGERISTRSIRGVVKDEFIKNGFNDDKLTAHSLRHSSATIAMKNGASLEEVQELLRHEQITTTMIYLHHIEWEKTKTEQLVSDTIFN